VDPPANVIGAVLNQVVDSADAEGAMTPAPTTATAMLANSLAAMLIAIGASSLAIAFMVLPSSPCRTCSVDRPIQRKHITRQPLIVKPTSVRVREMPSVERPNTAEQPPVRSRGPGATREAILEAARQRLLEEGLARLSTRSVAEAAGVPLSQLHYHFGSKRGLILALLEYENARRLARQTAMYGEEHPLWQRYEQACDFLEDDLESGYVSVLQEMIAAGWSDPAIGDGVRELLRGWFDLLTEIAATAEREFGPFEPFPPQELAALIGLAFMGGESMILLGFDRQEVPVRSALRRVGVLIRQLEEGGGRDAGS
jgi:AcrR family transcriptional regulator